MKRGTTSLPPRKVLTSKAERVYINLGRTGDAIASVPLCYLYWKETGKKAALMVGREFAGFLDGISYIQPEIWTGDWKDIPGAKARCRMLGYKEIKVAQIYGYGISIPHTQSSFLLESWFRVGRLSDFFTAPLVFDKRNPDREQELVNKLPQGKPIVLVAADGISSPFQHRQALFDDLRQAVGEAAHIVDLKDYRTDHFHDFLGLFDAAACLVTIDTGFGQLACASPIPVVALAADHPGTWYSSPRRPQHVAYVRYGEYPSRKQEVIEAVLACVGKPVTASTARINHVWAGIGMAGESLRRHNTARETWVREAAAYGNWRDCRVTEADCPRNAGNIGEKVPLPFIHDMMNLAASKCEDDEVLMITNADICLVPGLPQDIANACARKGATYCHRWDFPKVVTHIDRHQIIMGKWYVGCDLFACTKKWWMDNRDNLPDFVLGRECWDWVFRELIKKTGGSETRKGIYHEKHASPWEVNRALLGNLHNRSYARAWLQHNKIPLAEIENEPYLQVQWPPNRS